MSVAQTPSSVWHLAVTAPAGFSGYKAAVLHAYLAPVGHVA
jgi:hypothetical protein